MKKRPCSNNQHSIKDNNPHSIQSKSVGVFIFCLLFMLFICSLKISFAQNIEIPSSFNPVGSGARAMGMGGAFIGVADDATAASWNPGGLIQLRLPEISFVGVALHRIEDISFGGHPEADGDQTVSLYDINYLSIVYPFTYLGRNMVVSVNYQNLFDFEREWKFYHYALKENYLDGYFHFYQKGYLTALGIAYGIQVTPRFSIGLTLNLWEDDFTPNEWESRTSEWWVKRIDSQDYILRENFFNRYCFNGFNMNLGLLWNVNSKFTIGAVLKSPFDADLEYSETYYTSSKNLDPNDGEPLTIEGTDKESQKLRMPMSYGLGFAYRFSDEFTASLDIYRTEWDDFVYSKSKGNYNPITGQPIGKSKTEPTWQLRMGAEYIFTILNKYPVPFRGGIFYDPVPSEESPDDYFGFSLGSGIVIKQFVFDIAYQYRSGSSSLPVQDFDISWDVEEHKLYLSMIYHL